MTRKRNLVLLGFVLALALAPMGCGEDGTPVPPMGSGADVANLPEGERLAEEGFAKTVRDAEAKQAAKATKAAKAAH